MEILISIVSPEFHGAWKLRQASAHDDADLLCLKRKVYNIGHGLAPKIKSEASFPKLVIGRARVGKPLLGNGAPKCPKRARP